MAYCVLRGSRQPRVTLVLATRSARRLDTGETVYRYRSALTTPDRPLRARTRTFTTPPAWAGAVTASFVDE